MQFTVIGITDNPQPFFPPEILDIIRKGKTFSGGRRHHEIVAPFLPKNTQWIDITVPLDAVFEQYHDEVVVFASGDPLFFGFANTLQRQFPDAELKVYPTFNSLQMLAHRMLIPYHDMRIVSLTGRPWQEFDKALIEGAGKIGILTDKEHTPAAIARRMLEYSYTNYNICVGEHLGNPELEKITTCTLQEAAERQFSTPNCVIAQADSSLFTLHSSLKFGIPDSKFTFLDGREKMITKMPIRLLTLQSLDLGRRHTLWDIGACTGSISIEARLLFPHLQIEAFEIRPECKAIIQENARRFGAPGINVHIGDFLNSQLPLRSRVPLATPSAFSTLNSQLSTLNSQLPLRSRVPLATPSAFSTLNSQLPLPDAVFIGGHGGKLKEMMEKVLTVLAPDGVIVMNSVVAPKVTTDSRKLWNEACQELGLQQEPPLHIQLNDNHPITILKCKR